MVRRRKKRDRARVKLLGSGDKHGTCYLFLFPFDLYHQAGDEPLDFVYKGVRCLLYPPFSNDPPGAAGIGQVRINRIPRLQNSAPPHTNAPMVKRIELRHSKWQDSNKADALRLDWYSEDRPDDLAMFVDRLLELLRFLSLQWWITRDRRFDEGYLKNSFSINEVGERLDGVTVMAKMYGGMGVEQTITRDVFEASAIHAARGCRAPISILTLCDALYFHAIGETRRQFVEAAVACEMLFLNEFLRVAVTAGMEEKSARKLVKKLKFEDMLDFGLQELVGRSFADSNPEQYEWLKALWVGRGNVAHGLPEVITHGGERRVATPDDRTAIMNAVVELFMWTQQFTRFEVQ